MNPLLGVVPLPAADPLVRILRYRMMTMATTSVARGLRSLTSDPFLEVVP
jgi:hypothetical protein